MIDTETRPNVLFVFSDQHRASALGCAGNDDVQTPTFDRFAGEGTRFENAYTNYAVCTPSRACLLSGQFPLSSGVIGNDYPLDPDVPTVAEAFRDAGYRTGYVGKWHLDGVPRDKFTPPGPRRQGFDDFWAAYNCSHDYVNPKYYRDTDDLCEPDGYEPAVQTDLAIEAIDEFTSANDDRPFCLFLSWGPPHDPYELVPDEYRDMYNPEDLSMRPNAEPLVPGDGLDAPNWRAPPIREWGPTTSEEYEWGERYEYDDQREVLADYYAQITALDDQFGRLLDELDERGLTDDTMVTYTSDHGDLLYSQGLSQKGPIYEESIGIPYLVRWPDEIPEDTVSDTLVSMVDVAPTLLGLADVPAPADMEGVDLSEEFHNPDLPGPDSVYISPIGDWRGIRTHRHTYARLNTGKSDYRHIPGGHWLLFDNKEDPYQLRNVVLDGEYADIRAELSAELDAWMDRVEDNFESSEEAIERLGLHEETEAQGAYFDETFPDPEEYPE